jgi:hypothetical protein
MEKTGERYAHNMKFWIHALIIVRYQRPNEDSGLAERQFLVSDLTQF